MATNPNDPLEDVEGYVNQSSGAESPQFGQAANTSGELDTEGAFGHAGATSDPGTNSGTVSAGIALGNATYPNATPDTTAYDAGYSLGEQEIAPTALAPNSDPGAPYNVYDGTTDGADASDTIVPGDTTQAGGHSVETAAEIASRTDHGTGKIGPDIDGGINHNFGASDSGNVPFLGIEDTTLVGGYPGVTQTGQNLGTGNYATFYGQDNNAPMTLDTTNTSLPTTVAANDGTATTVPDSYTLSVPDTLYGYPGLTLTGAQSGVAAPVAISATRTATDGGAFTTGTYYYVVTAVTAAGESTASNEVSATATAADDSITVTWNAVSGVTGYKVYRGTAAGAEDELIASPAAGTLSFKDLGAAGTAATVPTTNTTGARVPGAPTAVAWVYHENSAVVSFTAPTDTGGLTLRRYVVVGYRVRSVSKYPTTDVDANARLEPTVTQISRAHIGTGAPATTSVDVHNLEPGAFYYFRVYAENDLGAGPMSSVTGWTPPASTSTPTLPLAASQDEVAYLDYRQSYDRI